jgi:POT family proton-dependent oligopeptide transporter
VAVLTFIGGTGFWLTFRKADRDEDKLTYLPESSFMWRMQRDLESPVEVPAFSADASEKKG